MTKFAIEYGLNGVQHYKEINYMADVLDAIRILFGDGVSQILVKKLDLNIKEDPSRGGCAD